MGYIKTSGFIISISCLESGHRYCTAPLWITKVFLLHCCDQIQKWSQSKSLDLKLNHDYISFLVLTFSIDEILEADFDFLGPRKNFLSGWIWFCHWDLLLFISFRFIRNRNINFSVSLVDLFCRYGMQCYKSMFYKSMRHLFLQGWIIAWW